MIVLGAHHQRRGPDCGQLRRAVEGEDGVDPSRSVHGSPVNIEVIVDSVLGKSKVFEDSDVHNDAPGSDFETPDEDGDDSAAGGES